MFFGLFGNKKKKKNHGQPKTIFERITFLVNANIHAALDEASDPKIVLDQFVRDFADNIDAASDEIAKAIGQMRLIEKRHHTAEEEAVSWQRKALQASNRADDRRAKGDSAEADRLDHLAATALRNKINAEKTVSALGPQIEQQARVAEQLKAGLNTMKERLDYLRSKRSELLARSSVAAAQEMVVDSVSSLNTNDPTSQLNGFERQVQEREALAMGKAEVAASSLDSQFAELDNAGDQLDVEDQLAAMKAGKQTAQLR